MKDVKSLSPIKRAALAVLDSLKQQVLNECDDTDVSEAMVKFHPSSHKDYINKNDYINADEALKILGFGYNRKKLFELTNKYGIKNHTMNNQHIGFLRKEIEELACRLKNN